MKNKVLLIGLHDGKTLSGVYYSFRMLVSELANRNLPYWIVNLGSMQEMHRVGSFSFGRSFEIVRAILKTWIYLPFCSLVYLTIAISLLGFFRDMLIILPAYLLQKKTVIHVHSGGYGEFFKQQSPLIQKLIKFTISKVDTIIILSKALTEQFLFMEDTSKCVVVHNMVDPLILDTDISEKEIDPSKPINLLYLSNMMIDKGYLDLLEACRILKEGSELKFVCHFCGEFIQTTSDQSQQDTNVDQLKQSFLKKVQEYQLGDYVVYDGVVAGDMKKKILRESHLFILPTRYPWEGQPVSILEAMANGIPVISTNFRAIPDLVIDGRNGYLLDSPSPEIIAKRIVEMSDNPTKYQEMSRQAIEFFWSNYSPDVRTEKMISLLYGDQETDRIK